MNEESLFELAVNTPDADRAALLDRECAGDAALRARIEALLAAHFAAGSPLDPPADGTRTFGSADRTASHPSAAETAGVVVAGRYKLLQQIGEGGMGTVWMADQTEPVKRRVAVKLIRVERGQSKTILSRFEAERQAIALMDHPHIAKLLDAGSTDDGSPFFVMELVKGVPLNEFCDAHRLSIPDRLQLFVHICSAVQHAHQKGIIHRDLKPSNILVEAHDGKPVPKVIDFGLAKATTGLQLTEHTLFTGFGSVMGTPLYMAPEQAAFNAVDVDTRADVYALGVILYELLTGTTPLTRDTIKKAALDEMLRLIREQEAPTPSSRLSASDSKPSVAANRQTEPAKLGRFVRGELDWIVLKALSKDRDRRYETANGFARDVERFLAHEPVTAGPPTARYRLRKFVQRNRGRVVAASLVLFALLAGIAGTTWAMVRALDAETLARAETARANDERDRAVRAEDDAVRKSREVVEERNRATDKADLAEAVSEFLRNDILGATTYSETFSRHTGSEITVAEAVDAAAAEVGKKFANRPLVEATIRSTLGNSYLELGKVDKAASQQEEAVRLFRRVKGDDDDAVSVLATLRLGWTRFCQNRLDEAEQIHVDAVRRAERVLPEDHATRILAYSHYATILMNQRKLDAAEPLFLRAIAAELAARGETRTLQSFRGNLALLYQSQRRYDVAESLQRQALAEHRRLRGDTHPNSLLFCRNLSRILLAQKKWPEAEAFAREALAGALKHLGDR
ncbi:MAG TPA: serine/threonine-protein kinase, partial [Gemmataceae bacterium]|nr:serine/threonine-protein kinase [Gemmataceae bacterium]